MLGGISRMRCRRGRGGIIMNSNMIIDEKISTLNRAMNRHLEHISSLGRGEMSQDILTKMRTFIENIICRSYQKENELDEPYDYRRHYRKMMSYASSSKDPEIRRLKQFHEVIKASWSHYVENEDASERLMLKYYEYFLRLKQYLYKQEHLVVLENLNKFPLNIDRVTQDYYKKISQKIDQNNLAKPLTPKDRYYIRKIKPFFVNNKIYYEVTFLPTDDRSDKFNRLIGFTSIEMSDMYAVKLHIVEDTINIFGKNIPIKIIASWQVAIRPCEADKYASILGNSNPIQSETKELKNINAFLTETRMSISDVLSDYDDKKFLEWVKSLRDGVKNDSLLSSISVARKIVNQNNAGSNIVKYLSFRMNNVILRKQKSNEPNEKLSGLKLQYGCIPFDKMPYASSLINHNPMLKDLYRTIDCSNRDHELLARIVKDNAEIGNTLFTPLKDVEHLGDVNNLIKNYNNQLYYKHKPVAELACENNQVFIKGYRETVANIVQKLSNLTKIGIGNYTSSVSHWLTSEQSYVDSDDKKDILKRLFQNTRVAVIYGAAGTGKTRLIEHVSEFLHSQNKMFLANTHSAVNNLRRRIRTSNSEFYTIAKIASSEEKRNCDILIVDECSTISNEDMWKALEQVDFQAIILVGDPHQIEAIKFGNWFDITRMLLPEQAVFKLEKPHRTKNLQLLKLWDKVRENENCISEFLAKGGYSNKIDDTIFKKNGEDEITLCLNYDGLYGINNINKILQSNNPNKAFYLGQNIFKSDDPVLFNDTEKFGPAIYNNLKGTIKKITQLENGDTEFDVEINTNINAFDVFNCEILESEDSEKSIIRFTVKPLENTDDDITSSESIVPFQIAYATSIHKAQGLEYDSVKIVIADEIEESVTHNIFYTAITRTRNILKIFWSPETEKKVLSRLVIKDHGKDAGLIRKYIKERM